MKTIILLFSFLFIFSSRADIFVLDNLTEQQFKNVANEVGANFVHSSVTTVDGRGKVFGFEVGVIVGATQSPEVESIAKSFDSSLDIGIIPHAGLMGQVSLPLGFHFEATMFPEKEISDLTLSTFSGAVKYTLTNSLFKLPIIDLAIRAHYSTSELSYNTDSNVASVPLNSKVTFDSSSWGIMAMTGADLLFVSPYIGIGYVSTDTSLGVNATTGTIFDSTFTNAQSAETDDSGMHFIIGTEVSLLLVHFGVEYAKIIDNEKATLKLSIGI